MEEFLIHIILQVHELIYCIDENLCASLSEKKNPLDVILFAVTFNEYVPPHDTARRVVTQAGGGATAVKLVDQPRAGQRVHREWARNVLLMLKTLFTIYTVQTTLYLNPND